MTQAIQMGHQQECHNTHLLCPLEEEEEAVCRSQTNHFLQQLHIWQVVSRSKHCVEHFAYLQRTLGALDFKPYLRFFKSCMHFYAMLLLTFICNRTTKIWWAFFTSPPIQQIMESVNRLVTLYAAKQNADLSEISFTVQLAASEPKLRMFQGQFKRHKSQIGVIWLNFLRQLCELSLRASLFSHMKRIFKQQRGSAIGNQISPSLANIAVSYLEHQRFQKQKGALINHAGELYIVRYVDNRLYSVVSIWQTNGSCKSFLQIPRETPPGNSPRAQQFHPPVAPPAGWPAAPNPGPPAWFHPPDWAPIPGHWFPQSSLFCIAAPMIAGGHPFLSDRSKANFPVDSQNQRVRQQKALAAGSSMLALTDQDEAWGKWRPSDSRSSKDVVVSNPAAIKDFNQAASFHICCYAVLPILLPAAISSMIACATLALHHVDGNQ